MLHKLHIQNYAIIDDLKISFSHNLNVITGETGAGKSILMGALNLILGQRADSSVLRQQNNKCIVEGLFIIKNNPAIKEFFIANDLDNEDEILIRREIAANGKSRSFINDTPSTLVQLKELSGLLVDLHQQFDTFDVSKESFQREVVDAIAGNFELLQKLMGQFEKYISKKKQLESLQLQQSNFNKELDYNRFLFEELEELSLQENELENLDAELKLLSNVETVKQQLGMICSELMENDQPILPRLKSLQQKLSSLQQYHPVLKGLQERISSAVIELHDIAEELEQINDSVGYDGERIQVINDRISAGYKLLKKHSVQSTAELIALQRELQGKLDSYLNIGSSIEILNIQTNEFYEDCLQVARVISINRSSNIKGLEEKVNKLLVKVGMPNARLKIQLQPLELSQYGIDKIDFLFDANIPAGKERKSGKFEPLYKVASGGELSRLMLSIKSLVAQKLQLPTLIFDEIDTGISGEAAKQVGMIMKDLSSSHQLISITHQPQIAAMADAHYFVYKEIVIDKIVTSIRLLNNDECVLAIAKMLSGERPTAAAMENAREMVGN